MLQVTPSCVPKLESSCRKTSALVVIAVVATVTVVAPAAMVTIPDIAEPQVPPEFWQLLSDRPALNFMVAVVSAALPLPKANKPADTLDKLVSIGWELGSPLVNPRTVEDLIASAPPSSKTVVPAFEKSNTPDPARQNPVLACAENAIPGSEAVPAGKRTASLEVTFVPLSVKAESTNVVAFERRGITLFVGLIVVPVVDEVVPQENAPVAAVKFRWFPPESVQLVKAEMVGMTGMR